MSPLGSTVRDALKILFDHLRSQSLKAEENVKSKNKEILDQSLKLIEQQRKITDFQLANAEKEKKILG